MRVRRAIAVLLTAVIVMSACGDDDAPDAASDATTTQPETSTSLTPKSGGSLTVAVYSEVSSLDPIIGGGTGFTGASEQSALYDVLVRYDSESGEYVPQTAESLTANDDKSVWTLTLREGITFSDGTPYDATAVKTSIERHTSAKSQSQFKAVIANNIKAIDVVDDRTVQFTLTSPWAGFPVLLAGGPGRVVSPASVEKLGDQLSTNPVGAGAGPFVIDHFTPKEALVLKRNPNYWGGPVPLDELKFVLLAGSASTYETLKAGEVQVAYLRDPELNEDAKTAGYEGIEVPIASASTLQINAGVVVTCNGGKPEALCAGAADGTKVPTETAGRNANVRRAIAAAIDPDAVNDRVYDGKAVASSSLIPPGFPWDPGVPGPAYDPAAAKELVQTAKNEGWDGKVRLLVQNAGPNAITGQTLEPLLRAAGIDVVLDGSKDTQNVIAQVLVNRDYDTVTWGFTLTPDDTLYLSLLQNVTGTYGYSSDEMNAALAQLRVAATKDDKVAALAEISRIWARDVPAVTLAHYPAYLTWGPGVHDVAGSAAGVLLFDKAWTE